GGSAPAGRPPVAARRAAAPAGPADVDGNGVIDVLDARVVAPGVKAGRQDPAWDVTGDGVVDRRDVDVIAATAVRVGGRPQ
ncbi:MAG: hypothetical protein JWO31_733, partial [Phycisphaerales bacterium]|nr:hypothetical protein [Phycisphaerales bacterium]